MNNILAIANKELRGYFASPIAYIVIGLFALAYGYFFYALLLYFDRMSMQMASWARRVANVNEQLISPSFQNTMVVFLFILPMVTMRTYSEEKRSGTIELLLTAPLTDFQIIMGKFLGAMALYRRDAGDHPDSRRRAVRHRQP
jgi:ABC-2 type transport system permease protein